MEGTKHADLELGFERLIMYITGMSNIRDVNSFPENNEILTLIKKRIFQTF